MGAVFKLKFYWPARELVLLCPHWHCLEQIFQSVGGHNEQLALHDYAQTSHIDKGSGKTSLLSYRLARLGPVIGPYYRTVRAFGQWGAS